MNKAFPIARATQRAEHNSVKELQIILAQPKKLKKDKSAQKLGNNHGKQGEKST